MTPEREYVATLLTTQEAADLLGILPSSIRRWVHQGKLTPVMNKPPVVLFDPADVLAVPTNSTGRPRGARTQNRISRSAEATGLQSGA